MKSLIYLSNARLPTEKANGFQIMKTCQAFASTGLKVTLLHPRRQQPLELEDKTPWDYYGINPNFTIRALPTIDLQRYLPNHWFRLQAISHVAVTLLYTKRWRRCPDTIFFSRDIFSMYALLVLRPFIKAKLIFEAHVFPNKLSTRLLKLFRGLDLLIVITHQLKRLFIEAGFPPDKILVVPDAVDLVQFRIDSSRVQSRQRLGLPIDRFIIGYIGRFRTMDMEKGIPELMQAMGYLHKWFPNNPPLLLCVGGPLEYVAQYEKIARQNNISSDMYRFVDRVPNIEVPYWMRACDVGTIPWSWNEFSAYYTSPMKLFEYMASYTPIVASNLPALKEILVHNKNAILVEPGNALSLAEGLRLMLEDSKMSENLARQAMMDVQEYTWENRANHVLSKINI